MTLLKLKLFRIRLCDWKVYMKRDYFKYDFICFKRRVLLLGTFYCAIWISLMIDFVHFWSNESRLRTDNSPIRPFDFTFLGIWNPNYARIGVCRGFAYINSGFYNVQIRSLEVIKAPGLINPEQAGEITLKSRNIRNRPAYHT